MKKILAIIFGGMLFFGLISGALAQNPPLDKEQEEAIKKLSQDMAILSLSLQLASEKDAAAELIKRLEGFKADGPALQKKISGNWLPALKDYVKMIDDLLAVLDKFAERQDIIPESEIQAELNKCVPSGLQERLDKTMNELKDSGLIPKLFPKKN